MRRRLRSANARRPAPGAGGRLRIVRGAGQAAGRDPDGRCPDSARTDSPRTDSLRPVVTG